MGLTQNKILGLPNLFEPGILIWVRALNKPPVCSLNDRVNGMLGFITMSSKNLYVKKCLVLFKIMLYVNFCEFNIYMYKFVTK